MNFLIENNLKVFFKITFIFSCAFIVKVSKRLHFMVWTYHGYKSDR